MGQTANNSGYSTISRSVACVMCQYNGLNDAGLIYCEFIVKTAASAVKQGDERQFPRVWTAELKTTLFKLKFKPETGA